VLSTGHNRKNDGLTEYFGYILDLFVTHVNAYLLTRCA